MKIDEILALLDKIKNVSVLCVGDIMLDRYIYGKATRISPEAPVPVLKVLKQVELLGGVGNVVKNLGALGARPKTVSLAGDDSNTRLLEKLYKESNLPPAELILDKTRPTSVKTRIIAGIQQVVRCDEEDDTDVGEEIASKLIEAVKRELPKVSALALSDYGKGTLTADVICEIISLAKEAAKPIIVDPKGSDYSRYRGAMLVTPNRAELSEAVGGKKLKTIEDLEDAGRQLMDSCGLENLLITRSEDGMMLLSASEPMAKPVLLASQARAVFDVSGAGDTVVAVLAAAAGVGAPLALGAALANLAAGVVVGKVGTASAKPEEIRQRANLIVP